MARFCFNCGGDADEVEHWRRCDGRQGRLEAGLVPVDPWHNVRRTDPETSVDAAFDHPATRRGDQERVRAALRTAGAAGLTDYELAAVLERQQNSAGKRRGELRDAGLVCDSGRRRPAPSGSRAIVWILVEFLKRAAS